jgi:hypothetical protein
MKKKSFLRDDASGKKHVKIVISDPDAEDMVLVVSVSSISLAYQHDTSCELSSSDHPWLKHPSFVAYIHSTELNRIKILQERFRGEIILKEDVSDELLKKIQQGARRTKFLKPKFKKYFEFF